MLTHEIESSHLFAILAGGLGAFVVVVVAIAMMWNAVY
jgi:uncharacterized membrane protein